MFAEPPSSLVVLTPQAIRCWSERPRRYLDINPMPSPGVALVNAWFETDIELTNEYHLKPRSDLRRLVEALWFIWSNRHHVKRASLVYCHDGMYFNALLMLSRIGFFRARRQTVRRYCFHDSAVRRLVPMLKHASPAFQIECITRQQHETFSSLLGPGRMALRPWKIDTEWYQPDATPQDGACLLAGNACRDDAVADGLLARGIAVTRAGRADLLQRRFAHQLASPLFKLALNTSHPAYLALLRSSRAVLLPILPCDEPAGLTAAMEALACEVPILANRSMGISELFEACRYPLPLVDSLDPEAWAMALRSLEAQKDSPVFREALEASRRRLLEKHSILPGGRDWLEVLASVTLPAR